MQQHFQCIGVVLMTVFVAVSVTDEFVKEGRKVCGGVVGGTAGGNTFGYFVCVCDLVDARVHWELEWGCV